MTPSCCYEKSDTHKCTSAVWWDAQEWSSGSYGKKNESMILSSPRLHVQLERGHEKKKDFKDVGWTV